MSSTLTVTTKICNHSGGLVKDQVGVCEKKTNIQGSHEVTLQRTYWVSEDAHSAHLIGELCPLFKRYVVKQPPHSCRAVVYAIPIESQVEWNPSIDRSPSNVTEQCLFNEIVRLRTRPAEYVEELQTRRREIVGSTLWTSHGAMRLIEGATALDEAISALTAFVSDNRSEKRYRLCDGLCLSAQDLALDVGPKGLVTQCGTDDSCVQERASRYGRWFEQISEIAMFGVRDPVDILCHILIDDGVPSRIHRNLLLDCTLNDIGVCVAPHSTTSCVSVIVFAGQFLSLKPSEMFAARQKCSVLGPLSTTCAYCFGTLDLKRCLYGIHGKVFHKSCFFCKVCKSSLRHSFFVKEYEKGEEPLCKDCVMFRWGKRCQDCNNVIKEVDEEFTKNGDPLCKVCFVAESKQLVEGFPL